MRIFMSLWVSFAAFETSGRIKGILDVNENQRGPSGEHDIGQCLVAHFLAKCSVVKSIVMISDSRAPGRNCRRAQVSLWNFLFFQNIEDFTSLSLHFGRPDESTAFYM